MSAEDAVEDLFKDVTFYIVGEISENVSKNACYSTFVVETPFLTHANIEYYT